MKKNKSVASINVAKRIVLNTSTNTNIICAAQIFNQWILTMAENSIVDLFMRPWAILGIITYSASTTAMIMAMIAFGIQNIQNFLRR